MNLYRRQIYIAILVFTLAYSSIALAASIPFKKYRLLTRGMSAAEVIALVGEPDNKMMRDRYWTNMQSWFYVPDKYESQPWQTVIHFDRWGYVKKIDHDKVIRARPTRAEPL